MRRGLPALLLAAMGAAAHAGDVIVLADGRTIGTPKAADPPEPADFAASNLTITDEQVDGVAYRLAGVPARQTLPRAQVRAVFHDPALVPADLTEGAALIGRGRFDEGRNRLSSVTRNSAAPPWSQCEAAYRRAESFAIAGDAEGAVRGLAAFAQERPKSRYVLDAKRLRARLLWDLGRDSEAKSEHESIAQVAGVSDDEALAARFLAAWIDARPALRSDDAKSAADAAKAFDEIAGKAAAGGPLAQRCAVARSACLAAQGRADESLAALVASSGDPFVLAVGNTLLADALRRRAGEKADRAVLEEAQERYLRVVLLYREADGASDFVAAAWFHAAELFMELKPPDEAGAAEARARARREWEDLARRYPRSEWGKRAKAAAAALQ